MNKVEQYHNERKEYWRNLINQCDASGKLQKDWCQENGVSNTSMSKWRNQIWREEEAEKEFAAAREEHCFVEIKAASDEDSNEGKGMTLTRKTEKRVSAKQTSRPTASPDGRGSRRKNLPPRRRTRAACSRRCSR